jgi:hypothetical protein
MQRLSIVLLTGEPVDEYDQHSFRKLGSSCLPNLWIRGITLNIFSATQTYSS